MLTFHSPIALAGGLASLALVLIYLRLRFGDVLRPLSKYRRYRCLLAAIAGWLGAWIYLPESWLLGPRDTLGYLLPGTIFGLLVLIPLLDDPVRQWVRSAMLLWVASIAHAAIWIFGVLIYGLLDSDQWPWLELLYADIRLLLAGIPAGIVFGALVLTGVSRVCRVQISGFGWAWLLLINAVCGAAYVDAVTYGVLPDLMDWLPVRDGHMYLVYVVWFSTVTAALAVKPVQPATTSTRIDAALLVGLVILTLWTGVVLQS